MPPTVWPRVLAAKFAGSWPVRNRGLSLGREGPSIQMGGALGVLIGRLRGETRLRNNPALVAGAAAGLAAAFGAPAAGMLFAFEEMEKPPQRREYRHRPGRGPLPPRWCASTASAWASCSPSRISVLPS